MQHLRLDWNRIKPVMSQQATKLNDLLTRFSEVFSEELGMITPFEAKLAVDPAATPKFFRPRPVPFALKAGVEKNSVA